MRAALLRFASRHMQCKPEAMMRIARREFVLIALQKVHPRPALQRRHAFPSVGFLPVHRRHRLPAPRNGLRAGAALPGAPDIASGGGIVIFAAGIFLQIVCNICVMPGQGFVLAAAWRSRLNFGTVNVRTESGMVARRPHRPDLHGARGGSARRHCGRGRAHRLCGAIHLPCLREDGRQGPGRTGIVKALP